MLDEERYAEIYDDADMELRQAQTKSDFISYLKVAKVQLALEKTSRQFHVGIVFHRDYANVVLNYEIDTGDWPLREEIWWRVRGQQATLTDYLLERGTP
jgi:hypothetical protein